MFEDDFLRHQLASSLAWVDRYDAIDSRTRADVEILREGNDSQWL